MIDKDAQAAAKRFMAKLKNKGFDNSRNETLAVFYNMSEKEAVKAFVGVADAIKCGKGKYKMIAMVIDEQIKRRGRYKMFGVKNI